MVVDEILERKFLPGGFGSAYGMQAGSIASALIAASGDASVSRLLTQAHSKTTLGIRVPQLQQLRLLCEE